MRAACLFADYGRIWGEAEPPNLATETNAGCGVFQARNPKSPVRIREGLAAKTPRNRGDFSGCARVRAGNLRNGRLSGGASRIRTRSIALLSPALRWGESRANPNRPNLPTEKNAGYGHWIAVVPPSPVRIREGLAAKTPRTRGDFSGCARVRAGTLRNGRLSGGAGSLLRTRLCGRNP